MDDERLKEGTGEKPETGWGQPWVVPSSVALATALSWFLVRAFHPNGNWMHVLMICILTMAYVGIRGTVVLSYATTWNNLGDRRLLDATITDRMNKSQSLWSGIGGACIVAIYLMTFSRFRSEEWRIAAADGAALAIFLTFAFGSTAIRLNQMERLVCLILCLGGAVTSKHSVGQFCCFDGAGALLIDTLITRHRHRQSTLSRSQRSVSAFSTIALVLAMVSILLLAV